MNENDIELGDLVEWRVRNHLEWYGKYGVVIEIMSESDVKVAWLNDIKTFKYTIHRASSLKMISRRIRK